jgi:hypothetical protein
MPGRFDGIKFDKDTAELHAVLKKQFEELADNLSLLGSGRSMAKALNRLEESFMWVGKGLRDLQAKGQKPQVKKESSLEI